MVQRVEGERLQEDRDADEEIEVINNVQRVLVKYMWTEHGPEPVKWIAEDGTIIYRDYEAYCCG
jgi:hypothetical protein